MALPILDGNQTAATLSTIVTSGEHTPAHTVVSLGSQAIIDMRSAVSGSVVSISNFPASQSTTFGAVTGSVSVLNFPSTQTVAGTVTIGNSVTANSPTRSWIDNFSNPQSAQFFPVAFDYANNQLAPIPVQDGGFGVIAVQPAGINWNISGTVTANLSSANLNSVTIGVRGSVTLGAGTSQIGSVTVGNSVTIGSLPAISGTVTANGGDTSSTTNTPPPAKAVQIGSVDDLDTGNLVPASYATPLPIKGTTQTGISGDRGLLVCGEGTDGAVAVSLYGSNSLKIYGDNGDTLDNGGAVAIADPRSEITAQLENYASNWNTALPIDITSQSAGAINVTDKGANGEATVSSFTSTTSTTLKASNTNRKLLTVFNEGAGNLYVLYGSGTASTTNYSVRLSSGDYLEVDKYTGQINAIFATAGTARVTEIT